MPTGLFRLLTTKFAHEEVINADRDCVHKILLSPDRLKKCMDGKFNSEITRQVSVR